MQEAPASNESLARILPVDDVVDGGEIGFAVALAALGRGELPCPRLRVLYALRRCRMRGEKILRARIERGLSHFQFGVTLHRRQETRRAKRIEMGARRNTDADTVRLEFLGARKARHRQLGFRQRKCREVGIVTHVGDDAGDDGGLTRLVLEVSLASAIRPRVT